MRTGLGLLFLLAVPAAAAAQGTEVVSCRPPHQVYLIMDAQSNWQDGQGWRTVSDISQVRVDRFERADFTRTNVVTSEPDRIVCSYLSPSGEVQFKQIKEVPRGTCEATGWDVDQNDWAFSSWKTSDLAKAKVTCKAG